VAAAPIGRRQISGCGNEQYPAEYHSISIPQFKGIFRQPSIIFKLAKIFGFFVFNRLLTGAEPFFGKRPLASKGGVFHVGQQSDSGGKIGKGPGVALYYVGNLRG
jgi:hypothetical protein